ncbi:MAG: hypothetical protein V7642_5742 [Burkholderiales bacterium]|jgi:hypothetical protein
MNTKDLNFAYKVRNALNENIDNIPASTAERLASARKIALSRKKKDSPLRAWLPQRALAGDIGVFFDKPMSWLGRMGLAVPALALVAGLISIYQFEQQQRISDTAEIDAGVLSDELPLSAYLDHGFNAYLAKRGE